MVIWPAWSNTTRSTDIKIINLRAYDKIYKKREKKKKIFFSPNFCSFFISAVSSVEQIIPERNPTSTNSKLDTDLQMNSTTYVTVN